MSCRQTALTAARPLHVTASLTELKLEAIIHDGLPESSAQGSPSDLHVLLPCEVYTTFKKIHCVVLELKLERLATGTEGPQRRDVSPERREGDPDESCFMCQNM